VETATSSDFASALAAVSEVEGWMTDDQARRLWDAARAVPPGGRIVEIGSYRGRSAIVLARAAAPGSEVVAIDPHAGNDRGPQEIEGYASEAESDHAAFLGNLEGAGVRDRVRHVRLPSERAHPEVTGDIALLYVDGAHRYGPARNDIRDWGARVAPGGTLLIHDGFSSIGVTLATLRLLVPSRSFRYAGRTGSLVEYRRETARLVPNALRQVAELPWFLRNILVKAALVAHLRPLARLLGHRSGDWPY
jgi:SAM-dependent methyltransferase